MSFLTQGLGPRIDWGAIRFVREPPRLRPIPPPRVVCGPCHGAGWVWRLFGFYPLGDWWRRVDCECQETPGRAR